MTKSGVLILGLVLLLNTWLLSACGGERPVLPPTVPPEPLPGPQLVLDNAFGAQGQVRTGLEQYSESYAAVLQPDGKIIAVGTTHGSEDNISFGLVRYLPDGTLDASFGDGGKVVTNLQLPDTPFDLAIPYAAALQQDGKVVVAGFRSVGNATFVPQLVVIRYTSSGELDTTFGAGGFFSLETGTSVAYDAVVQPDGKIAVAGKLGYDTLLLRLTPEGSLDRAFGTGGTVSSPGSFNDGEPSVALTKNGRYLVASGENLARYNQDGTVDTSFERPTLDIIHRPTSLALQVDGRIVLGTTREVSYGGLTSQTSPIPQTEIVVRRFSEDGTVDTSFGRDGAVVIGEGGSRAMSDLTVQPDGQIVVAGGNALVAQLGVDGVLEASAVGAFENAETVLVTNENAVVIVGYTLGRNRYDFALAKFLPQAAGVERR